MEAYRASKTLAERAAWEFVETHQPAWDLTTINPPFVYGPIIQEVGEYSVDSSSHSSVLTSAQLPPTS
jgi:hypothetical protein